MFENYTFEYIMERMLSRVPDDIDKRQGSIIYDAIAPAAIEMAELYQAGDMILNEVFADSASFYYLLKHGAVRGIKLQEATKAIWKCSFSPSDIEIPIGYRFNNGEYNLVVKKKESDGIYSLECETAGAEGNYCYGDLIPIDHVDGLETADIISLSIPGEDEESEEEYRLRYFASINSQNFGGNVSDYKEWVDDIQGTGAVKVYPVWKGGGTVKLVIINSEYEKPSEELVSLVQETIDPEKYHGLGMGRAPIGHTVTVVGVDEIEVNINTKITFQSSHTFDSTQQKIEDVIDTYLKRLKTTWSDEDYLVVRISQIENYILQLDEVLDIMDTKINGAEENLILHADAIPIRGVLENG